MHEDGWQVRLDDDMAAAFIRPNGRPLPLVPPPSPLDLERTAPLHPVEESLAVDGIEIDAWTSTPAWLGERLDVGWALDVLRTRS